MKVGVEVDGYLLFTRVAAGAAATSEVFDV